MQKQNLKRNAVSAKQVARIAGVALVLSWGMAYAGTDAMGSGICALVKMLTGKWLFGFTILATLGAGAALLFGAEITDGMKKLATIITVVGMILGMSSILTMVFQSVGGFQACT